MKRLAQETSLVPASGARTFYFFPLLLALLLLAFFLRSYFLDKQSLWGDEAYTLSLASRASWQSVVAEVLGGDANTPHTPLYYLALMPWLKLVGNSDFALRWFSVAFGLLTVPASYVLARRLTGTTVAGVVTVLSAISPFLVYYSQEARMYAMVGFLATLTVYFLVRGLSAKTMGWWLAYSFSGIVLLFTFNLGLVLVAALFLVSIFPHAYRGSKRYPAVLSHLGIGLSFLSWQTIQSSHFQMGIAPVPFQAVGLLSLDTIKDTVLAYTFGVTLDKAWAVDRVYAFRDNPLQPWGPTLQPYYTTILAVGAMALASFGAWKLAKRIRLSFLLLLLGLGAVVLSVVLLRLTTLSYAVRLTLIASPLFMIFLAAGLVGLPRFSRPICLSLLVLVMSYSLWQNYQNPAFSRSEYRVLAEYLSEELQNGDAVYLHGPVLRLIHDHYLTAPYPTYTIPRSLPVKYDWGSVEAQLDSLSEHYRRLWLVLGGEVDYDPNRQVERWLIQHGYLVERQWFGNSRLELFVFPEQGGHGAFAAHRVDNGLDLLSSTIYGGQAYSSGQDLPIALTWKRLSSGSRNYRLSLRLLDTDQALWAQDDIDLGTDLDPVSYWKVDQPVTVRTGIRLSPGIPPGRYFLKALVYTAGGHTLPGGDLGLVPIRVVPGAPGSGSGRYLNPPSKADIRLGPLHVTGYDFPQHVRPGDAATLRLYWETEETPQRDYSLAVRFGNSAEQELPILPAYPTSKWNTGEALISQHSVKVPADAMGQMPLSIGLVGQDETKLSTLTSVALEEVNHDFQEVSMQRTYRVDLGGKVMLLGMDLGDAKSDSDVVVLRPGTTPRLAIYWKDLKEMGTSYTVFVQLLDAEGHLVAQEDAIPNQGERPTTGWLPGEIVKDWHHLVIPAQLPPGRYSLISGMYDPQSGRRLGTDGGDFVTLMGVLVRDN